MKVITKSAKEILFFVTLVLGLTLFAGLSTHGAPPAAAQPALQEITPSPAPTQVTPVLEIVKSRDPKLVFDANNDKKLDPGDKVRYKISYRNSSQVVVTGVAVVDDYDQTLVSVDRDQISADGGDDGDKITWMIGDLPPDGEGEVTYVVTLISTLIPGSYTLKNVASISSMGVVRMERAASEEVIAPVPTATETSTPSLTPSPTLSPTVTPVPTSAPPVTGVGAANLQDPKILWPLAALTLVLELGGLVVLGLIATKSKLGEAELSRVIRVGFVVTLTVGAVLIMGVFAGIERGAAAGILGTVAGYLLRGIKDS